MRPDTSKANRMAEDRRVLTPSEFRVWLYARIGRDISVSVELNQAQHVGPMLTGTGTLEHSSGHFEPTFLADEPELASMYTIGSWTLSAADLEQYEIWLSTAPEYNNKEYVEVIVPGGVGFQISDPF